MIRNIKLKVSAAFLLFALFAVAAWADQAATTQQYSGFLGDYSKLTPAKGNPNTQRWISPSFNFAPYQKILLDPVEVWVSPTSVYKGASPDLLKGMADSFTDSFTNALQSGYQLVTAPGPDVLQIRLAITGVNLVKPGFKPRDVLPISLLFHAVSGPSYNVALTAEMQVLDPDNNVVAEALSTDTGSNTVKKDQDITWKDLQSITDKWAQALRKGLDEARGITPQS